MSWKLYIFLFIFFYFLFFFLSFPFFQSITLEKEILRYNQLHFFLWALWWRHWFVIKVKNLFDSCTLIFVKAADMSHPPSRLIENWKSWWNDGILYYISYNYYFKITSILSSLSSIDLFMFVIFNQVENYILFW